MLKFHVFGMKFTAIFFLIFVSVTVLAQDNALEPVTNTNNTPSPDTSFYQDPTEVKRESDPYFSLLLRVIGILLVFALVAFVTLRIVKSRQKINQEGGPFKLIYDFPISINKSLKVIQIVNEFYLLGVSQDNIQLICKLEDKETIDTLMLEKDKNLPRGTFFQDIFAKHLKLGKIDPLDMTKKLKSRLKKME